MTGHVGSMPTHLGSVVIEPGRTRTVRRNVAAAEAAASWMAHAAAACAAATTSALSKGGMGNDQEYHERSKKFLHCSSATCDGKVNAREDHEIGDC